MASSTGEARALTGWRYFNLGYLFFLYLPFWFSPVFLPRPFWASVAATAVFLPIYLAGFHARGLWRMAPPAAIAAIGLALVPLNAAGNTFIIYAMSLAAYALFLHVFVGFKAAIPLFHPFAWDELFVRLDRALFLGHDPWRVLQPLVGKPAITNLLDLLYYA